MYCENSIPSTIDKALEIENTNPDLAMEILEKAYKDNPSSFDILFHLGRINYERVNKTGEADTEKSAIRKNASFNYDYYYQKAFNYLVNAHQIEPKHPDTILLMGKITFYFQKFKECIIYYNKFLELVHDAPEPIFEQGVAYFSLGDFDNAEKNFKKGVKINPSNGENYYNLGIIKQNQKKYAEARTYFIQASNIFDGQQKKKELVDALVYAGICAINEGKDVDGIKYYNSAIDIDPENSMGYFNLAAYYAEKEYYDRALQIYNTYLNKNTHDIYVYQRIVSLLKKTGKYQTGISILTKLEEKEPGNAYILFHLGQLYYLGKDYDNAKSYFQKCIEGEGKKTSFGSYSLKYLNEIKEKTDNKKN